MTAIRKELVPGTNESESVRGKPRMRVLFLLPTLGGGGAERVIATLVETLDRHRFEPHVGLLNFAGPHLKEIPPEVTLHDLRVRRVRYALPAIIRLVWNLRPQVILSTLGHLNFLLILSRPFLPKQTKLLVREATTVSAHLQHGVRAVGLWTWLYRHLYKRADKVVCLSEHMVADLHENFGVPLQKLVCIHNPIDVAWIRSMAEASGNPYKGRGPHLLAVGRLSWEKGFDLLVEAMPYIRKQFPHARLTILGQGPLESNLTVQRELLGLREVVDFPGFRANPYPLFKYADLFVLSSRYEGLPNAALEAIGLGTPVVATNCIESLKEVVHPTYPHLLLCPPTTECLADSILSVLAGGRNSERRNATWPTWLSHTLEVSYAVRAYEGLFLSQLNPTPARAHHVE